MSNTDAPGTAGARNLGLDAVRATAILLVLICHWSNNVLFWFGVRLPEPAYFTGDLGVSLFFALSGFLIGGILIDVASVAPTWDNLRVFLTRRWMRTLPLYWAWLAVLLLLFPPVHGGIGQALRFASLTQNLVNPMPPGWWFAVSWSLVVEEWFYILFGTAAFLAFRLIRSEWAIWAPVAAFLIAPPLLRAWLPGYAAPGSLMYQIALLRIDQIAYGVAAAALYRSRSRLFRPGYALGAFGMGVGVIAYRWLGEFGQGALSHPNPFPHPNYLMLGCALVLPLALRLQAAPRWLDKITRALSAQSYGLYLMHMTLLVDVAQNLFFRRQISIWTATAIALISPFLLSYLSYRFFEGPILRLRPRHDTRQHEQAQTG